MTQLSRETFQKGNLGSAVFQVPVRPRYRPSLLQAEEGLKIARQELGYDNIAVPALAGPPGWNPGWSRPGKRCFSSARCTSPRENRAKPRWGGMPFCAGLRMRLEDDWEGGSGATRASGRPGGGSGRFVAAGTSDGAAGGPQSSRREPGQAECALQDKNTSKKATKFKNAQHFLKIADEIKEKEARQQQSAKPKPKPKPQAACSNHTTSQPPARSQSLSPHTRSHQSANNPALSPSSLRRGPGSTSRQSVLARRMRSTRKSVRCRSN